MALPSENPFAFVLTVSALPYNGSIHLMFVPSLCLTMFESLLQTSYPLFHRCPIGRSIGSKKVVSNTPKPPTSSSTTGKYRIWVHKPKVSVNIHVNARFDYLAGLNYNFFRITKLTEMCGPIFSLRQGINHLLSSIATKQL